MSSLLFLSRFTFKGRYWYISVSSSNFYLLINCCVSSVDKSAIIFSCISYG